MNDVDIIDVDSVSQVTQTGKHYLTVNDVDIIDVDSVSQVTQTGNIT